LISAERECPTNRRDELQTAKNVLRAFSANVSEAEMFCTHYDMSLTARKVVTTTRKISGTRHEVSQPFCKVDMTTGKVNLTT
jgi:hypothetical protein